MCCEPHARKAETSKFFSPTSRCVCSSTSISVHVCQEPCVYMYIFWCVSVCACQECQCKNPFVCVFDKGPVCGLFLIQSDILSPLAVTQQPIGTLLMTTPPWGFWYGPLEPCLLIRVLPCSVSRGVWQDKWLSLREGLGWISSETLMWCLIRF